MEIADALTAAHRQGIVHRDLKPGNIMLTSEGQSCSTSVWRSLRLAGRSRRPVGGSDEVGGVTAQGTILGTLPYMAPEQLEGREADARTDIFAFGAIVYEMLTGKKAFDGKSQAGLIASIMHSIPPPTSENRPVVPPALDRIVQTCLAKDPDDRWQSARDVLHELRWVKRTPVGDSVVAPQRSSRLAWAIATLCGIAALVSGIRVARDREPIPHTVRFTVAIPARTLPASPFQPEISPDGTRLAFAVHREGERFLAIRSLDAALEAQVLAGTSGAAFPFWSPDSSTIAFFADGKLKTVLVSGGPPQIVCDARPGLGGTWNRQGVIVFLSGDREGLYQVPATGGQPTALNLTLDGRRFRYRPQFLPDGRRFLYFVQPDAVYLASLEGGDPTRLPVSDASSMALFAAPGYLLFRQGRTIAAQRFDVDLTKPLGEAVPIVDDITPGLPPESAASGGGATFSVSENGMLAYWRDPKNDVKLGWLDRAGRPLDTFGPLVSGGFDRFDLSPDNMRIAFQSPGGPTANSEIWLFDLNQRHPTQLTFSEGADRQPIWSPDSRRLVFASRRKQSPGSVPTARGRRAAGRTASSIRQR